MSNRISITYHDQSHTIIRLSYIQFWTQEICCNSDCSEDDDDDLNDSSVRTVKK